MPYLRPATNNYFGFMPMSLHNARTNIYLVSSSEANQISPGDVVVYTTNSTGGGGTGTVRRRTGSTTTDAGINVGVAASLVVANGGSTSASLRFYSSQNVLVYDDPLTLFVGCDTTSGVLGVGTLIGHSVGVVSTGVIGSTGPHGTLNRSVQAVSIVTASSQGVFRIVGIHPIETGGFSTTASATADAATEVRKLILAPDMHVNAGLGIGLGRVTT